MKEGQVKALAHSGVFDHERLRARLLETHISWVLLAGRFAFKIKKPLKLSFLDFSSLRKRKKFCEKELQLNRRFSDIYLAVKPVRESGATFRIGKGNGRVVDYAVQMKRLQDARRMDRMLQAHKVDLHHIVSLAGTISQFHTMADIVSSPFDLPAARANFNDLDLVRRYVAKRLSGEHAAIIEASLHWSDAFLKAHRDRFQSRIQEGFHRDVHGDLHSGNIFLYRRPVIFDCIEFNDAFRQIDVLNEIAFFCMDLEANGEGRLSQCFLAEYLRSLPCFQQPEDRAIFRYYKCYRANVRAKVHALAAQQEEDSAQVTRHLERVKRYLRLMHRYMRA